MFYSYICSCCFCGIRPFPQKLVLSLRTPFPFLSSDKLFLTFFSHFFLPSSQIPLSYVGPYIKHFYIRWVVTYTCTLLFPIDFSILSPRIGAEGMVIYRRIFISKPGLKGRGTVSKYFDHLFLFL